MTDSIYQPHDHSHCIDTALQSAVALCQQKGMRLTPIRKRVFELVWQSHKPMGAYDLLPTLADEGFNSAPPTVYRALDFLLELGLIHRLASLNAYIGCSQPAAHQSLQENSATCFLLCQCCGQVEEIYQTQWQQSVEQLAQQQNFQVAQSMTEVLGLCSLCQQHASDGVCLDNGDGKQKNNSKADSWAS